MAYSHTCYWGKLTTKLNHTHTHTHNLFHSIANDVRFDHEDERRVDVSHFEIGESSRLQVLPCFPGDLASVAKVVPRRLENVLEEVRPSGGVCHNMLNEKEGSALQSRDLLCAMQISKCVHPT